MPTRRKRTTVETKPKATSPMLSQASNEAPPSKNIIFAHGKPGIGKTALFAHAPNPVFLVDPLEMGILKLMERGIVPKVDVMPAFRKFEDFVTTLDELAYTDHNYETVVIDSLTGIEQLLFRFIADTEFGGKLNKDGFYAFQAGPDTCMKYAWPELFSRIVKVRDAGLDVYITGHSNVQVFNDPQRDSYDRWEPVLHKKTWKAVDRVMDNVLFLDRHIEMDKSGLKNKAKNIETRVIRCEWSPAFDAKNRLDLPPIIEMGSSGAEAWANFSAALKG